MNTQWLPAGLMDRIREHRRIYQALRAARWWAGNVLGARRVSGVYGRVHHNDFMFSDTASYLQGAKHVTSIIQHSVASCHRDLRDISRCLEIGCGYGRIIRNVVQLIPPAGIYACDVIEEAARFTASEFGINYLPTSSLGNETYSNHFDLIYLISVFTHTDEQTTLQLWSNITRLLRPGGIVVFTTHGQTSAGQMENYGERWGKAKPQVINALAGDGYYYEKYKWYDQDVGMTWGTEEYMRRLLQVPGMELRGYVPAGLDGHQDVYWYQKGAKESLRL